MLIVFYSKHRDPDERKKFLPQTKKKIDRMWSCIIRQLERNLIKKLFIELFIAASHFLADQVERAEARARRLEAERGLY